VSVQNQKVNPMPRAARYLVGTDLRFGNK